MVKIENSKTCAAGLSEWIIRFKITESLNLNLITICRDNSERRTQYSFQDMRPDAKFTFRGASSGQFRFVKLIFCWVWFQARFFQRGDEDSLYKDSIKTLKNLQSRLRVSVNFGDQNNQLSRGHLTANSDFVFAPLMNATYYYYNAAPQFQAFNGMNWSEVEKFIRNYVNSLGHDVTVYTGVYVSLWFLSLNS